MKRCRMCESTQEQCGACGWVPELEMEEDGICIVCLQKFLGMPFRLTHQEGPASYGNLKEGVRYAEDHSPLEIMLLRAE